MLSDRRHPCFGNFDSVVSIDVIRMKSYLDSLFDPTCVSVRVMIDKLLYGNLFSCDWEARFVILPIFCGRYNRYF